MNPKKLYFRLNKSYLDYDLTELENKIKSSKEASFDEEEFKSFRLARGIYGQRQQGVQMIRIKVPYGKILPQQLVKVAKATEKYSNGVLHISTRQNFQIYYVKIDDTPKLWRDIDNKNITLREACGNTIRNITLSPTAGVDSNEPFDVSEVAQSLFEYFLRNPLNQDLGRKMKFAFSSSIDNKESLIFIHDIGYIPKIVNNKQGFSIYVGGGLGAQPRNAEEIEHFIEKEKIIPYTEAIIRVFNLFGERKKRMKARLKFLIKELGLQKFKELVYKEIDFIENKKVPIKKIKKTIKKTEIYKKDYSKLIPNLDEYKLWKKTNIYNQKQKGLYGVFINPTLGNITSKQAIGLSKIVEQYADNDIRLTQNQGIFLRNILEENLLAVYYNLLKIGLSKNGFNKAVDVTSCPGTDTCNLGISNSTKVAEEIEKLLRTKYSELILNTDIKIKLSGCPNSCGQHGLASIGFHGSSQKVDGKLMPFMQVCLGGAILENGYGIVAEKVIKIPSKRVLLVVSKLIEDYNNNKHNKEFFYKYYKRKGKIYFYNLLKEIANVSEKKEDEYIDWANTKNFEIKKAVGECAGVAFDLFDSLVSDALTKILLAKRSYKEENFSDSLYHSYNSIITSSKAILLNNSITFNTQMDILKETEKLLKGKNKKFDNFINNVLIYKSKNITPSLVTNYINYSKSVLEFIKR